MSKIVIIIVGLAVGGALALVIKQRQELIELRAMAKVAKITTSGLVQMPDGAIHLVNWAVPITRDSDLYKQLQIATNHALILLHTQPTTKP